MDPSRAAAIDLVEASYDLELPPAEWLPNLLQAAELDLGLGYYGLITSGSSEQGPKITQVHASPGADELPVKVMRAAREVGPEVAEFSEAMKGRLAVVSEIRDRWPRTHDALLQNVGCADMLSLAASDLDFHGVSITIPSPGLIRLTPSQRESWQMIGVHIAAGHRLRRSLGDGSELVGTPVTEMPLDAEALIDPSRFVVSHAARSAKNRSASEVIREAAVRVDRARGALRRTDPEEALRLWKGLVRGRWSLIDWFDTDGRRFVLAKPNVPSVGDPRGLTAREAQVASYAACGDSSKLIGYRLGLSVSHISHLLRDAQRKLGVKTKAQLVEKLRGIRSLDAPSDHPS